MSESKVCRCGEELFGLVGLFQRINFHGAFVAIPRPERNLAAITNTPTCL